MPDRRDRADAALRDGRLPPRRLRLCQGSAARPARSRRRDRARRAARTASRPISGSSRNDEVDGRHRDRLRRDLSRNDPQGSSAGGWPDDRPFVGILALLLIASALFTVTAQKPVLQRRRAAGQLHRAGGDLPDAARRVLGSDPDHRLQRRDPDLVRVRDRAALERREAVRRPAPIGRRGVSYPAVAFAVIGLGGDRVAARPLGACTRSDVAGPDRRKPACSARSPTSGHALFTRNLLPFEITAFLLMVAIIGVVLLAGDEIPAAPPRRAAAARARSRRRGSRSPDERPGRSLHHPLGDPVLHRGRRGHRAAQPADPADVDRAAVQLREPGAGRVRARVGRTTSATSSRSSSSRSPPPRPRSGWPSSRSSSAAPPTSTSTKWRRSKADRVHDYPLLFLIWLLPLFGRDPACGRSGRSSDAGPGRSVSRADRRRVHRDAWPSGTTRRRPCGGAHQALFYVAAAVASFGLQWDRLSLIWTLIITGVGFLIHVYSIGYLAGDTRLRALLRVHELLRLRDAHAGALRQLRRAAGRLGPRRPRVVSS